MLQENSDCDIDDQSSDFSVDMNFDKEHLLPESSVSLASLFDSLLFDFEDNPLGRLRVNLKEKEMTMSDISSQRRELRRRSNLSERYQEQSSCIKQLDLVSLRLKEDQMHLVLFLEETSFRENPGTFSHLTTSLREELVQIMEPIMCHFTMTMGKTSMVHWFNDTILPLFLNDSPSALYILCEECWMTVHDTLKRKVKSLDGFREYKMQKKLEIMKMKQENSLIELPAVTFSKHPFSDLSASKVASTKKPLKDNTEIKQNSLTYTKANSALNRSSSSTPQSPNATASRNFFSPISAFASQNSSPSNSRSSPNSTFISPNSSVSSSPSTIGTAPHLLGPMTRSPTEMRVKKRRDLCGTKKQVKIVKNVTPSPLQPVASQTKRKRENMESSDPVYSSGANSLYSSSSGSTSDEYIDLVNLKKNQTGKTENSDSLSRFQYKPGRFRF